MTIKTRLDKLEAEADQGKVELYSSFRMVTEHDRDQHIPDLKDDGYVAKELGSGFTAYRRI